MKFLTTREVADLLRKQPDTLAKWRKLGKGPPYQIIEGGIVYEKKDVDAWIKKERKEGRENDLQTLQRSI